MAAVRAAWQRRANQSFLQDDAKRAPKVACYPSSCGPHHDCGSGDAAEPNHSGDAAEPNHSAHSYMPLNWNPMSSNLPSDTKWWLQLQPNFDHHKDFTCQHPRGLKDDGLNKEVDSSRPSSKLSTDSVPVGNMAFDYKRYDEFSFESSWLMAATYMNPEAKVEDIKTICSNLQEPLKHKMDIGEYFCKDEMMDWKPPEPLVSSEAEKQSLGMESPWAKDSKSTPWWRITDKDELAELVAQKAIKDNVNCDLPRSSRTMNSGIDPHACLQSLESDGIFSMSSGQKSLGGICGRAELVQHSYTCDSFSTQYSSSGEEGCPHDTKKQRSSAFRKEPSEAKQASESDTSRAQLLEALLHSQTRAREAEMAAQKAYNEKEHILTLLFKQASHLFAYKQWVHILQLETLYLQLKIKENQIATLIPVLPWMPLKGNPTSKDRRKGMKEKNCNFCKCAVVFVIGLGLAGAGMFLGWTLGWLFPISRPFKKVTSSSCLSRYVVV